MRHLHNTRILYHCVYFVLCHLITYLCVFQIFYMLEPLWRQLLLENLPDDTVQEALASSYPKAPVSMDSSTASPVCKKSKMQPYLDTCYSQNNTNAMCDLSFNSASTNVMYCQSEAYVDTTHSINTCETNRKHRSYFDRQKYKAIRKWKQIGGGKDYHFSLEEILHMRMIHS